MVAWLKRFMLRNITLDPDFVSRMVRDVSAEFGYEQVYLCGDYARGNPGPDSRVDVYVWCDRCIYPSVMEDYTDEMVRRLGKDVKILTPGYDPDYTLRFIEGAKRCRCHRTVDSPVRTISGGNRMRRPAKKDDQEDEETLVWTPDMDEVIPIVFSSVEEMFEYLDRDDGRDDDRCVPS